MDLSEVSEDHSNYHGCSLTPDWQFTHQIDPWIQSIQPSGFIERAAMFSCFNGASQSPMNNDRTEAEVSGDGDENSCARKRKRNEQEMGLDRVRGASHVSVEATKENLQKGEQKSSTSTKASAKNVKDGADGAKEDYVHVRARRGQATNSHSLAERVRREKISERMKLLQDLVPGCSKVTGKAVMLDEIINYVQSLQRQVEFLSMKLAAVNPRLGFGMDGLLSKDLLRLRDGSSAVGNFSPGMVCPQLQRGLFQAAIPGMLNTEPCDGFDGFPL